MENKIDLKLSLNEINLLFKALGNLPFKEVYELVGKINDQANHQIGEVGKQVVSRFSTGQ